MDGFLYQELPSSSIRLLRRVPSPAGGPWAGAVHCELVVTSLAGPDTKPYEALSYVWGDMRIRERDMVCNGRPIKITANLWAALRQIWAKWPEKKLWVDAVCINQEDTAERNGQVMMMGDIYKTAQCVIVWIGSEATSEGRDFCEAVKIVEAGRDLTPMSWRPSSIVDGDTGNLWNTWKSEPLQHDYERRTIEHQFERQVQACANHIMRRPWFTRVWTLQEVRLSTRAILLCGPHMADFKSVLSTLHRANDVFRQKTCMVGENKTIIPDFYSNTEFFNSLFGLLSTTTRRCATDPRDKVFALLSMLPQDLYGFARPDYSLSVEDVFTWACRICIEVDRDFGCLMRAGLRHRERSDRGRSERGRSWERDQETNYTLPSWVADWSRTDPVQAEWDLSRLDLSKPRRDVDSMRLRFHLGENMDKTKRDIQLRAVALGRRRRCDHYPYSTLVAFPRCALRGVPITRCLHYNGDATYRIKADSDAAFVAFLRAVRKHDDGGCDCSPARNPPGLEKLGDWVWATDLKEKKLYSPFFRKSILPNLDACESDKDAARKDLPHPPSGCREAAGCRITDSPPYPPPPGCRFQPEQSRDDDDSEPEQWMDENEIRNYNRLDRYIPRFPNLITRAAEGFSETCFHLVWAEIIHDLHHWEQDKTDELRVELEATITLV